METVEELLQITDQIKELDMKILEVDQERTRLGTEYAEIDYKHYTNVQEELNAGGKPRYTNEERRRREKEHRMRNNEEASVLLKKLRQQRAEDSKLAAEVNRLVARREILLISLGAAVPEKGWPEKGFGSN